MTPAPMKIRGKASVEYIRGTEEDKQFYPSTPEIISAVRSDIIAIAGKIEGFSFLDIGAGDGRVLEGIAEDEINNGSTDLCKMLSSTNRPMHRVSTRLMGIEQSPSLTSLWHHSIKPVGTDLFSLSLMDISADYSYTNPPFNHLKQWLVKVIEESRSKSLYFVSPPRWKKVNEIKQALEDRNAKTTLIGTYSFADSDRGVREDRAVVDLVRVDFIYDENNQQVYVNPMSLWLKKTFGDTATKEDKAFNKSIKERLEESRISSCNSLVSGSDYVESMVALYEKEVKDIHDAMVAFSKLDTSLICSLGFTLESAFEKMQSEINCKRASFWKELLGNLKDISEFVGSEALYGFRRMISEQSNAEFNTQNIREVILWILKNAHEYNDSLFTSTIDNFLRSANIEAYKSNKSRLSEGDWEYAINKPNDVTHFKFNTTKRLIIAKWHWKNTDNSGLISSRTLVEQAKNIINDLLVLANNFGFPTTSDDFERRRSVWESGEQKEFFYTDKVTGEKKTLMKIKAFKSGTLHFNFDRDFISFINIEFGKRNGWISSSKEAAEEMGIPQELANKYFNNKSVLDAKNPESQMALIAA